VNNEQIYFKLIKLNKQCESDHNAHHTPIYRWNPTDNQLFAHALARFTNSTNPEKKSAKIVTALKRKYDILLIEPETRFFERS